LAGSSVGCSNRNSAFRPVGYFKDDANNRIHTIAFKPGATEQEINEHAEGLMHTQGQMLAAYYYSEGSVIPADGVTLAGSLDEANNVLYEVEGLSSWRYAFMRYFRGNAEFVDCELSPDNPLCRKN
jgi:hypothetical protein